MTVNTKLSKSELRSFLNKDFDSFRADLLLYAKTFFPDKIQDFSEASVGGLLLDMAAYVGDVMSFYLDYQFSEIDISTATETKNIEKLLAAAGVKITGASPAVAEVMFLARIDADPDDSSIPNATYLPKIMEGTVVSSNAGVDFILLEDIDFAEKDIDGNFKFTQSIPPGSSDPPSHYTLKRSGACVSGKVLTKTFNIPSTFQPFRSITLPGSDISEIISVYDSSGNIYYEVDSLSQNTVFKKVKNYSIDSDDVLDNLELLPAPRRFIVERSRANDTTAIRFGSGRAETLDNDIIPDPSELSLPLYGKKTFKRFSIDPNNLLNTSTLGISPINTVITVKYRSGGGLSHNVGAGSIRAVRSLLTSFNSATPTSKISLIRSSIGVINEKAATGGELKPTINQLKQLVVSAKNSQSRIVTREDLLSHIYMMPSNFGRVYRAGIRSNPDNPLATLLYIVSRDKNGRLTTSSDSLKDNLSLFLNENRLISDAIDILDSPIVNIGIKYVIVTSAVANKNSVLQNVNSKLKSFFQIKNFQIDQPIILTDIQNIIINTGGVISLTSCELVSFNGTVSSRVYSGISFNVDDNTIKGIITPPAGGMFELLYPNDDVVGSAE